MRVHLHFSPRFLLAIVLLLSFCTAGRAAEPEAKPGERTATLRGKVVWIGDAMQRLHGVRLPVGSGERLLVLETKDGELHPLIEDVRGRAFRRDERLRGIPVELVVKRHAGSPLAQVIRVYALEADRKFELDYWCDICAIAMFELKECECCQGPIELRRRQFKR